MEYKTIREHRKAKRYTQRKYAELIDMNPNTFITKETGRSEWTLPELRNIKKQFHEIDLNILEG